MAKFVDRRLLAQLAFVLILFMPSASIAVGPSTLDAIKTRGVLLWGSDSEGGAPYVFPDPQHPSRLIGFELDIMETIAKQLGVKAQLVQTSWDSLIPALERGDFDMAMNGLEIIPEREKRVLFSRPYYQSHRRKPLALAMGMNAGIVSVAICQIIQYISCYGFKGDNPVFHPRVSTRDLSERGPHIGGAP